MNFIDGDILTIPLIHKWSFTNENCARKIDLTEFTYQELIECLDADSYAEMMDSSEYDYDEMEGQIETYYENKR
jgi:hypothetical protein